MAETTVDVVGLIRHIEQKFGTHKAWLSVNLIVPHVIWAACRSGSYVRIHWKKVLAVRLNGVLYKIQYTHEHHGIAVRPVCGPDRRAVAVFTNKTDPAVVYATLASIAAGQKAA